MLLMKRFLLIKVFAIQVLFAFGQDQAGVVIGISSGINIAGIHTHNLKLPAEAQTLVGVKGVLFAQFPMGRQWSIQPELSFDQLGWQYHGEDPYNAGIMTNVSTSMQYLFINILPKYNVPHSGLDFYVGTGYGFLLGATLTGYNGQNHNVKNSYSGGDFAGIIGLDYFLSMGLGLSARFLKGVSNIKKEPEVGEGMHNYSISFTLSYKIQKWKIANAGAYPLKGR
jgi:Outer membrane protein beta-barrel domain